MKWLSVGVRLAQLKAGSGRQPGDPVRATDAIIRITEAPTPPLHLLLGKVGLERLRAHLKELQRTIDRREAGTLSADFPPP